ncbi:MAG: GGDEF domain-containing protein [Acidimicrobiales bacterium]
MALASSLFVGLVAGGLVIAAAIAAFEGDLAARLRKELTHAYIFHLPGATLGATVAVATPIEPWLGVAILVPAPVLWLVLRAHGSLLHRFSDLSNIHEFSSHLSRSVHLDEIADIATREIAAQMRARSVALVVWDDAGRTVRAAHGDQSLLAALPSSLDLVGDLRRPEVSVVRASDPGDIAAWLRTAGAAEALVQLLSDNERQIGVLVVADRGGASSHFGDDDRDRLRPITHQLGVALRKGQLQLEIQHNATHDRLTGLPNRAFFEAWMNEVVDGTDAPEGALLMLDLDRFKEVNDTLGHRTGDRLLEETATRLRGCVAVDDVVCRLGGDEFAIFVPGAGLEEASILAEVVSFALERPFELGSATVAVASSIGVSLAPDHGVTSEVLLHRADLAMYDAKQRHLRTKVYDDQLDGVDSERFGLLADLRAAIDHDQIDIHVQPIVDLRTGTVGHAEALARWYHPTRGQISPEVFIPVAEQAGLITALTERVLDHALAAVASWRGGGYDIGVAVTLSPLSLVNEDLAQVVAASLARADVDPDHLTLEITESTALGETDRSRRIIEELSSIGVHIAVDDFGTGYSSLVILRSLPFSTLKIDRSFVTAMAEQSDDAVIVRSTVALAHSLGMTVVAEGVESVEVLQALRDAGCDMAQGYGLCPPIAPNRLELWLGEGFDLRGMGGMTAGHDRH